MTHFNLDELEDEFQAIQTWLKHLEDKARERNWTLSQRYDSGVLSCYVRSSVSCWGMYGTRVISIANITVAEACRGRGFFTQWIEYLEAHRGDLCATHLYVENVANSRLALRLTREGFTQVGHEMLPSFHRKLGGL